MKRTNFAFITVTIIVLSSIIPAYAVKANPLFFIGDDYVIIEGDKYPIENEMVAYNGKKYVLKDFCLICDETDQLSVVVLPVEQNKITNPVLIAQLNASIGKGLNSSRAIPGSYVNLPYSASVPLGQYSALTPAFYMPNAKPGGINLSLSGFNPSSADKRFNILYTYCDQLGNWYSNGNITVNFGVTAVVNYGWLSTMTYGQFALTNLYANPSPSYTYSIN